MQITDFFYFRRFKAEIDSFSNCWQTEKSVLTSPQLAAAAQTVPSPHGSLPLAELHLPTVSIFSTTAKALCVSTPITIPTYNPTTPTLHKQSYSASSHIAFAQFGNQHGTWYTMVQTWMTSLARQWRGSWKKNPIGWSWLIPLTLLQLALFVY